MAQSAVRHNAPAGAMYSSIRDAGKKTLETYCDKYPNTSKNFVLPNMFHSSFPDIVANYQVGLTAKQKRQFDGFVANLGGERAEYDVHMTFLSMARKPLADPILVICGMKFDSDNNHNIKQRVLKGELPSISLKKEDISKEKDFVIFVSNIGVVLGEVKRTASSANITKAEEQLENGEKVFFNIMSAISGVGSPILPVVKMILIPHESGPSPTNKTQTGCHLVYQDVLQNFQVKWNEVVNELKLANAVYPINSLNFETLVQTLTGLWTMKPVNKRFYNFDYNQASLGFNIQTVDEDVRKANICSPQGAQFTSNTPISSLTDVFHDTEELNVLYFSPQQKMVFDKYPHALIRAHAGCGKTLIILLKIEEILEKDSTQKILLIAPDPHHIRCQNILEKHNITTEMFPLFPYTMPSPPTPFPPSCNVVIITLKNFFEVPRETLLAYDLSLFNIFVDDIHGYDLPHRVNGSTYCDIGDFIDSVYIMSKWYNHYCWFGIDVVQQCERFTYVTKHNPTAIFRTKSWNERQFDIPVVVMDQVLRNTKEIVNVLKSARNAQVHQRKIDTWMMIHNIDCGHHITGQKVVHHKLRKIRGGYDKKIQIQFVCERVEELFHSFPFTLSSAAQFDFSSVAILFEHEFALSNYKGALEAMLRNTFNLPVQTIKQQLITNNKHVVMDSWEQIQSYESAVVVLVRSKWNDGWLVYNAISRARTMCMVVDPASMKLVDVYFHIDDETFENADVVEWKETNGVFTKLT